MGRCCSRLGNRDGVNGHVGVRLRLLDGRGGRRDCDQPDLAASADPVEHGALVAELYLGEACGQRLVADIRKQRRAEVVDAEQAPSGCTDAGELAMRGEGDQRETAVLDKPHALEA